VQKKESDAMKHATELQNSQTQINQLEGLLVCPSLLGKLYQ